MCVVCGCGDTAPVHEAPAPAVPTVHAGAGDLHFGTGAARVSVPGMSQERAIKLEADVLGANQLVAAQNRAHFASHGVVALNLVSSPGSGKTTLLVATIEALKRTAPNTDVAVIEGDQQTSHDADRIRATGAPAIQVNTGKGCHLDAPMVAAAFARLPMHSHGHEPGSHGHDHGPHDHDHGHHHGHPHTERLLFIEDVGNLVCPALWDLGEAAKVVILSVTEGEDKPLKYPDMFAAARLMVLTKTDLLPHLRFDVARCIEYARRINPGIEVLQLSATSGDGMQAWLDWLLHFDPSHETLAASKPHAAHDEAAQLRRRVAELEAALAAANERAATQGAA
jgi:hydrogenase nickel incorporation protein HypB